MIFEDTFIVIIHGNDEQAMSDFIEAFVSWHKTNFSEDINLDKIDGSKISLDNLENSLKTIPFFSSKRYVIIDNPLSRLTGKTDHERFLSLLGSLPDTTKIILVIKDDVRKNQWVSFGDRHWLRKWADRRKKSILIKDFLKPKQKDMGRWIQQHTEEADGKISGLASHTLAEYVGDDTRFAHQEILKLLTYVGYKRQVEIEDVEAISIPGGQQDVFKMVDAIAMGNAKSALDHLHGLMENDEPIRLFGMIVRQFRLLIQVKELMERGYQDTAAAKELGQNYYAVRSMYNQARRFTQEDLDDIFHRLLDIDIGIKTGEIEPDLAMDLLIVNMAR